MVVPAGLVCFFPSYEYKEKVVNDWRESGAFQKIDAKKKVCIQHQEHEFFS